MQDNKSSNIRLDGQSYLQRLTLPFSFCLANSFLELQSVTQVMTRSAKGQVQKVFYRMDAVPFIQSTILMH